MPLYKPIHKWQTRLTVIKPNADRNARLELGLVTATLVDFDDEVVVDEERLVKYDALSYAWGSALASVACTCDGTELLLRGNLAAALRFLRRPDRDRYVWVDFICINQQDNVEKAFQIPRMKSIYSKASTVFVWLGEVAGLEQVLRRCNTECGSNPANVLTCPRHSHLAWSRSLGCSWFQRTWVRQEVYAARKLEVCLGGFSAPWETFIKEFKDSIRHWGRAARNVTSLNDTYNGLRNHRLDYRPRRLLELLYKGCTFQASVPHDHIYSVLGMIMTPDDDSELVPIDYNKSYEEVCGDVMRALIRESRDVRILELCALQDDKAHALDWPHIQWPPYYVYKFEAALSQNDSGPVEWFEAENPIRDAVVSAPLDSIGSALAPCPPITPRPLVLYGTVWGALGRTNNDGRFLVENTSEDHPEKKDDGIYGSRVWPTLVKHGLLRSKDGKKQAKGYFEWDYRGEAKEGDLFVSLEPGCRNFILRECDMAESIFEVVGCCLERAGLGSQVLSWYDFRSVKDEGACFLGHVKYFDNGGYKAIGENGPPGPRKRFLIR
ncbi:hypothetical protein PG985_016316 [Apiospora marii]|uniref:uncharacterized protein n=1 Tax=Apiospora marii TaxID=335849 RepID=UPI00312F2C91